MWTASGLRSDPALPAPTPDLFVAAGAIVADLLARGGAERLPVEQTLRRAVEQAAALRRSA